MIHMAVLKYHRPSMLRGKSVKNKNTHDHDVNKGKSSDIIEYKN